MNAQPISIATIKKWEAIAGDRFNHALVVYKRSDGMSVVDVFEVLNVFENEDGIRCLRASSLATKFNGPDDFDSTSMSTFGTKPEHDVVIPLSSIIESHRYPYGTGLYDADIGRYYESVAKVRQRRNLQTMSRSRGGAMRFVEIAKSNDHNSTRQFVLGLGCMMWLLYAGALVAFARWIF
jgi:hypothetical protein